jgi:hypothetical protein
MGFADGRNYRAKVGKSFLLLFPEGKKKILAVPS